MKIKQNTILIGISMSLAGCAAPYSMPSMSIDHPAHPKAAAASEAPRSKTLAYADAEKPVTRPVETRGGAQKEGHDAHHSMKPQAENTVTGEGTIIAVVPSSGQIVLEHGAIKDFMDAMTMGYRVESASLLEDLKQGDKVRFTIDIEKKAIIKVEKLNR